MTGDGDATTAPDGGSFCPATPASCRELLGCLHPTVPRSELLACPVPVTGCTCGFALQFIRCLVHLSVSNTKNTVVAH